MEVGLGRTPKYVHHLAELHASLFWLVHIHLLGQLFGKSPFFSLSVLGDE